jgi:hypothetical protein
VRVASLLVSAMLSRLSTKPTSTLNVYGSSIRLPNPA